MATAPARIKPPIEQTDVRDLVAFCGEIARRTLSKGGRMPSHELEEATAAAVLIAVELHSSDWLPERRPFSAFLRGVLPNRIIDWWRVEMRQAGYGSWAGSRGEYVYYGRLSLDGPLPGEAGAEDVPAVDTHAAVGVRQVSTNGGIE